MKTKASEEIHTNEVYGFLFGDDDILKYYSIEDNKVYKLAKTNWDGGTICSIFADVEGGEVYFGTFGGLIYSLFSKSKSWIKDFEIESIIKHKCKILDSGGHGLTNTFEDITLISVEDTVENDIRSIESLFDDKDQNLYALVWNDDDTHSIITLPEDCGKYSLGEEIFRYDAKETYFCQAIAIPGRLKGIDGKIYPFSIISCVNPKYLDINGKKIEGSEVEEEEGQIKRIALLSSSSNKTELIYSGYGLNKIVKVKIEGRKVKEKKTLISGLSDWVCALESVFDKKFHEKLVAKGETEFVCF